MASIEEKFNAAVEAIKKLPKDGPFQPSYDMMKKFYGLFKQATEGPCNEPRPAFWNAIKKIKWEAWSRLGNMTKIEAQDQYVTEMLKIVEAMPQTDEVRFFLQIIGPFFELVRDTEEDKVPNGALPNGDAVHLQNGEDINGDVFTVDPEIMSKLGIGHLTNGHVKKQDLETLTSTEGSSPAADDTGVSDSSHPIYLDEDHQEESADDDGSSSSGTDDEFCDSIDQPDISLERKVRFADSEQLLEVSEEQPLTSTPMVGDRITTEAEVHSIPSNNQGQRLNNSGKFLPNDHIDGAHDSGLGVSSSIITTPKGRRSKTPGSNSSRGAGDGPPVEMSEHIALVLERLQRDMNSVLVRLNSLETLAINRHQMETKDAATQESRDNSSWWPFNRVDAQTVFLIVVWPFVVNWVLRFLSRRRKLSRN